MSWGIGDRVGVAVSAGTIATFNSRRPGPVPSLVLDFAGTGTLDPRVTFTRSTTGRYYDSSTVALAEQNLFLQSNTFSNAAWVKTNGTIATGVTDPAGGTTASSFTANSLNATLYQTVTLTATPYTESIYIQRVSGIGIINLTLDGVTLSPVTITGSWVKYTYTATPSAGSQTVGIQVVTIGDVINIYGSQIENRSSATATNITTTAIVQNYIPQLMTAAINAARFDYNPTTRAALGLLIEQSSTNLLTYSQDFSNGVWTKTNATVTTTADIAPDGTQTANKLISDTTTNTHYVREATSASGTVTCSVYLKASEITKAVVSMSDFQTGDASVLVDLTNGTTSAGGSAIGSAVGSWTGISYSATPVGNGWYRVVLTATRTTGTGVYPTIYLVNGSTATYLGNGYSGIYIWGAQLEALAFPTSYTPTTSAQVTRASDNASMTGTNFSSWYNQAQGSVYAEVSNKTNLAEIIYSISDNSYSNAIWMVQDASSFNRFNFNVNKNGSNQAVLYQSVGSTIQNVFVKSIGVYQNNNFIVGSAGLSPTSSSTGSVPSCSIFYLGLTPNNGSSLNGWIKKFAFYPIAFTGSQIQALTGS